MTGVCTADPKGSVFLFPKLSPDLTIKIMNWSKVKVRQMPEIMALLDFHTGDLLELFDRDVQLISMITGMSEDYINAMKPSEFSKYRTELYELISTEPKADFNTVLNVGGRKFVFVASAKEVTVKELSEVHLLDIKEHNFYSKLPLIVSVFAKERTGLKFWKKKLSFSDKVELFKELPVDQANGIALFFCKVYPVLESRIQNSLAKIVSENLTNLKITLDQLRSKDGDGSKLYTNSRMVTLPKKKNTSK